MILLNHQHLYYFWAVATEGSVVKACKRLHLAQSTVSGQVIQFEKELGKKLFERRRKRLILTNDGRVVLGYAEKIFGQTREMLNALRNNTDSKTLLRLGVDADVSKQAALGLLEFVQTRETNLQIQIDEGNIEGLIGRLQRFSLDVVLSDHGGVVGDRGELVRSEVARLDMFFMTTPSLARRIQVFPRDLSKLPLVIPARTSPLWEAIQHFLVRHHIDPDMVIEIQDAGLMRQAALRGLGVVPLSSIAVMDDLRNGTLVKLGRAMNGIKKTLWLTARKDYDQASLVGQLMQKFRIS